MTYAQWRRWGAAAGAVVAALIIGGIASWPTASRADTWLPPETAVYNSRNQHYRLTVTPRKLDNQLRYFEDKVDGVEPAGQGATGPQEARGLLEQRTSDGRWARVWSAVLVNDVAPVSALVSDDGAHVVTFDNWHSLGFGEDVVVIYGRDGRLVRSLALTDILPQTYIDALPRSVSSLHWSGEHRIEGDRLILSILVPSDAAFEADQEPVYVEAVVDLATGRPQALDGAVWRTTLSEGARVRAAQIAAEAAQAAWYRAPLTGPTGAAEREWFRYLIEAFFRLDPDWDERYPNIEVLREPGAPDYAPSRTGVLKAVAEASAGDIVVLGSAGEANLARIVGEALAGRPEGSLEGAKFYVAASDELWPEFQRMFASTGAQLIQLDPAEPIPQRPERLPEET